MFEKLRKNYEFQQVYRFGSSRANKYLIMYILEREAAGANRYGFSISRKVGNSVVRHRIVRLLREAIRKDDELLTPGKDIVLIARPESKGKSLKEIDCAVLHLSKLHGVLR